MMGHPNDPATWAWWHERNRRMARRDARVAWLGIIAAAVLFAVLGVIFR